MRPWERVHHMQLSFGGIAATLVALVVVLFLRRLLPEGKRNRGKAPLFFLVLALLLRGAAIAADAAFAPTAFAILNFLTLAFLSFGISGVVDMLLFDILLSRTRVRVSKILRDLLQAAAFFFIIMGVLKQSGVNLLSLVTTSAVLTAVIGLALQSTLSNLLAGLALQVDQAFGIGDWLQVGQRTGRVTQMKWRTMHLVNKDGDMVIIPNAELVRSEVINFSRPTSAHRMWLRVSFHYRHPPNEVKRVLLSCTRDVAGVRDEPAAECVPLQFADSSIEYALRYWIDDFQQDERIDGELRTRIWYAAKREGLEIPFPIRTLYMNQVTSIEASVQEQQEFLDRMDALARIDLLGRLDPSERELLAEGMRRVKFAAGEMIIRQGDPGDSLYLIQNGSVGVRLSVDGAQKEVAALAPGDFFGEMSLVTGEPRTATCTAKTDVTCYLVDHASFQRLLDARPKIADEISSLLATRQVELASRQRGLSEEAEARRAADARSRLLARIRDFFHLG
ncbi:MAG: mechanosensitive ion channel [Deltaproteobacteria bacterium]|nr:mechanosensitive ion channel [Deltaproteobacteria bacterium]